MSPYCSLPDQVDTWFKAFKKAKEMCGAPATAGAVQSPGDRVPGRLVRGVYAAATCRRTCLSDDDVYLAIPLQKGQISCRELMRGEVLLRAVVADEAIAIDAIDSPYAHHESLRNVIEGRGI